MLSFAEQRQSFFLGRPKIERTSEAREREVKECQVKKARRIQVKHHATGKIIANASKSDALSCSVSPSAPLGARSLWLKI